MLSLQVLRNQFVIVVIVVFTVVFVDLVDSRLRLQINHHEEEPRLITCCSALLCGHCVRQVTSKGGGK
jgi:hypothetical protein